MRNLDLIDEACLLLTFVQEQYRLATPHLNIISQAPSEVKINLDVALKVLENRDLVLKALEVAGKQDSDERKA